jgi:hypothetical protein
VVVAIAVGLGLGEFVGFAVFIIRVIVTDGVVRVCGAVELQAAKVMQSAIKTILEKEL